MSIKQESKTTQSKTKKSESNNSKVVKDLLQEELENQKEQPLVTAVPKFPASAKTVDAVTYEMDLSLTVKMGRKKMLPPKQQIVTMSQVVDMENQIFGAGMVRIALVVDGEHGVAERTQGMDAEDVRLILRLLGLAK